MKVEWWSSSLVVGRDCPSELARIGKYRQFDRAPLFDLSHCFLPPDLHIRRTTRVNRNPLVQRVWKGLKALDARIDQSVGRYDRYLWDVIKAVMYIVMTDCRHRILEVSQPGNLIQVIEVCWLSSFCLIFVFQNGFDFRCLFMLKPLELSPSVVRLFCKCKYRTLSSWKPKQTWVTTFTPPIQMILPKPAFGGSISWPLSYWWGV